ncbi:AraC family transcriptional regulator, partial [Escherichia coli]
LHRILNRLFSDQSHFSTVFKQRFGMTPGEYRRKFR